MKHTSEILKVVSGLAIFALAGCSNDGTGSAGTETTAATTGGTTAEVTTTTGVTTVEPTSMDIPTGSTTDPTGSTTDPTGSTTDPSTSTSPEPGCGDGEIDVGEECDDGNADNTDACTSACKNAVCSDGFAQAGTEECDDANAVDTDACTAACKLAVCGDVLVQEGVEGCDDGNMVDTDMCTNACATAKCGDMIVEEMVEVCDDGNVDETDACTSMCQAAKCGDGFIQMGNMETCDDKVESKTCDGDCTAAACGDNVLNKSVGEVCDDGNMSNLDVCTNTCKASACDDKIQSGTESDVDCGGACMAKCGDGKMCGKSTDCGSGNCAMNKCAIAISCQQIKTGSLMAPDGIYTIDPDGAGMGASIKVFCDMTTDGGGWTMVFKVSSNIAGDANTLWNGPAVNENDNTLLDVAKATKHYVSGYIANYWNKAGVVVTDVRAHVYKGAAIQKFWKYDGKLSSAINWYNNTKLTSSSYVDLAAGPWNFYSILGENQSGRRFYVNRSFDTCGGDIGWLVVDSAADPCAWETNKNAAAIRILYAPAQTSVTWDAAVINNTIGVADVFAVFVR